ncbi:hypothetical protein [Nocardia sp. NPDC005366]|uniref:hypothetical protein n=1 Tax=Nocardia sp. NPDC005366 TaxID=3156878 RepID=UPI0033A0A063
MTEYEPTRITGGGENPKHHKHVEISGAFDPLTPSEATGIAARYKAIAEQWEAGVEVFSISIKKSIDGAWSGNAANSAKDAVSRYTTAAHELTTPMNELSNRVSEAAASIEATKTRLPDPVEEKAWWHKDSWPWVGNNRDGLIEDRQEEAQAAMKDYYVDRFVGLDSRIPVFPEPVDVTKPLDISGPTSNQDGSANGSGSGSGGSGSGSGSNPANTPSSNADDPKSADPEEQPAVDPGDGNTHDSENPSSSPTTPSAASPSDPSTPFSNAPTTPSGTNPAGTGTPSSGTPGSGTPGSGTPGSGSPGAGRSVTGTPGTATSTPTTAATAASSSGTGRSGMAGMGGMGAGRGGGQSEQDSSHGIPDYLITMENTEELLGEQPKTVPGGVIGGDPPQE